jgi:hypothetical protein
MMNDFISNWFGFGLICLECRFIGFRVISFVLTVVRNRCLFLIFAIGSLLPRYRQLNPRLPLGNFFKEVTFRFDYINRKYS